MRYSHDDAWLLTTGGADATLMQWNFSPSDAANGGDLSNLNNFHRITLLTSGLAKLEVVLLMWQMDAAGDPNLNLNQAS